MWETEFPWLVAVESEGKVSGMICSICKRHKSKNTYNQSTVWSLTPCTCLCKDSIRRHAKSAQHLGAVGMESHQVAAERDGGILQAFQSQTSQQKRLSRGQCSVFIG